MCISNLKCHNAQLERFGNTIAVFGRKKKKDWCFYFFLAGRVGPTVTRRAAAELFLPQPNGIFCLLLLFLLVLLQRESAPLTVFIGLGQLRKWSFKKLGNTNLFPEEQDENEQYFFLGPLLCLWLQLS